MGDWLPYPRSFPNQCFRCGNNDTQHGPYLEVDSPPEYTWRGDIAVKARQYWCKDCFCVDAMHPDSPLKSAVDDKVQRETEILRLEIEELKRAADPVKAMVDEVRRQIGRDRQQRPKVTK